MSKSTKSRSGRKKITTNGLDAIAPADPLTDQSRVSGVEDNQDPDPKTDDDIGAAGSQAGVSKRDAQRSRSRSRTPEDRGKERSRSRSRTPENRSKERSRSRSRSPIDARDRNWKSTNAFINYVQDFKQQQFEFPGKMNGSNLFRMAGAQWRIMSQEEKQPYIDGAAMVKQQKASNATNESGKKPALILKYKRPDTVDKNNKRETKRRSQRKKNPGLYLKVTDSESGSESDNRSSDTSL